MRPVILQVNTADSGGGAERVVFNLHRAYRLRGYAAWLAVGRKSSTDPTVLLIPNDRFRNPWVRSCFRLRDLCASKEADVLYRFFHRLGRLGEPSRLLDRWRGYEDFDFPGAWHLLDLPPEKPDIVHCHNLHGGYFDLRVLPWLSRQIPVILTLHDMYLLTGHCAHSFACERWKTGCGDCPDLSIPPAVKRDATAHNWHRKREIYRKSCLHIATPSRWLMDKVKDSMLMEGAVEYRVIPNGVDLSVFQPATNRREARASLGLSQEAKIPLFTANTIRGNIWKDYQTLRTAVALVAEELKVYNILFIALGEDAPPEQIGQAVAQFVPYQKDPVMVARYYQAADLYIHAARADTFPNTVLEALACGTPVVATAVGGIPEQVKGLKAPFCETGKYSVYEATGVLVPGQNAEAMAQAIVSLLRDEALRSALGKNAAKDARERFDLDRQVEAYLAWYRELLGDSPHVKREQEKEGLWQPAN